MAFNEDFDESYYLTDIPQEVEKNGFSKTLLVRREVIHLKHIFTECFIRKSIPLEEMLSKIGMSLFDYMEVMTIRLRHIHHFPREYFENLNDIVKVSRSDIFPTIALFNGLKNVIALDFDGVISKKSFKPLYDVCLQRCPTVVCSANPCVNEDWFTERGYDLPLDIFNNRGKIAKIKKLIFLMKKHDNVFYIDNEEEYLRIAWIFGIKTFIYRDGKIKCFTLKTQ